MKLSLPMVVTVLTWGFNFVALKFVYTQMPPASLSLARFFPMAVILAGICLVRKTGLRYPKGHTLRLLFLGFLAMGLYMVLFLEGMGMLAPATGAIILSTSPIFTALLAAAFRQEIFVWEALIGAFLALVGVALVVGFDGSGANWHGAALILTSALVWSLSVVVSRSLVTKLDPVQVFTLSMPGGLIVLLPYGWAAFAATSWKAITPLNWLMLAHIVILAGVVGFIGFYAAVRKLGSSSAMLYQFFVPPTAAICAYLFMGKNLGPLQLLGMLLVFAGVLWSMKAREAVARRRIEAAG